MTENIQGNRSKKKHNMINNNNKKLSKSASFNSKVYSSWLNPKRGGRCQGGFEVSRGVYGVGQQINVQGQFCKLYTHK